jgi:S1-C subfamily serine protease
VPVHEADVADDATDPARKSHLQRRREWRQEERARRYAARRSVRFPIFTRSVLLWMMIFALFGLAFGASGAFWWAHFNTQVAEIREDTADIEARSNEAMAEIEAERNASLTQIAEASAPLEDFLAEARTVRLAEVFADTVWFVATLDGEGRASVGSAFAVATDPGQTLLVTSYATVEASTVQPGPEIVLRNGAEEVPAELVSTDAPRDLALVRIPRGDLPVLEWATEEQQARALGSRVFAVSGFGGLDAFLTPGLVVDQSAVGFLHTAPVGSVLQGGPLVLADGRVIGVTSTEYRPLEVDPGEVHFSVSVNTICEVLLDCGGGRQERDAGGDAPPPEDDLGTVEPD